MPLHNLTRFPRLKFIGAPTPLEYLPRFSDYLGREIFIKRDDVTPMAMGGNKLRKLEFLAADALREGADTLITAGAIQSNHVRQTAAVAAKLGLHCVALLENDKVVSEQTYGKTTSAEGTLLENMLPEGEKFTPGKPYEERINVKNTGDIDTYVRVIITRSWQSDLDGDGEFEKDTKLAPSLIDLQLLDDTGWIRDDSTEYSDERIVLYYTKALAPEEETTDLSKAIRIDPEIAQSVTVGEDGKYEYVYDGYRFCLEAEVDAVQTHNAVDAVKSAWGVDITVTDDDGGTITSVN